MTALDDAPETSQFLDGVFAPVTDELDVHDLPVTGTIPPQLSGVYMRNGANPQFAPLGRYHWFDGDGMVHAVYLDGGTARYRNKWVETPGLRHERAADHALFGGILNFQFPPAELMEECGIFKNAANTNIVAHASKYRHHRPVGFRRQAGRCHDRAPEVVPRDGRADVLRLRPGGRSAVPALPRR
jgi:carotenoid cleavage dioxygenase-like enzyme